MTDTARTHARPNRNDFPVTGGCWLALSPPNLPSICYRCMYKDTIGEEVKQGDTLPVFLFIIAYDPFNKFMYSRIPLEDFDCL